MSSPKNIGVIIGSVRGARIGPKVATFVKSLLEGHIAGSLPTPSQTPILTLVDLKDFNLPGMDESILPAMVPAYGEFQHQHSKDWSAEIEKYDGYIIISPEYNYGVPGGLKNAIDYLYHAWIGKPMLIVSYGIFGGSLASESLGKSLKEMHLDVCETRPQLAFPGRDDNNRNMSTSLQSAMTGELHEEAKEAWESGKSKEALLKGYEELAAKFESKENGVPRK